MGLRLLLPFFLKQIFHFTQIPYVFLHSNAVWILMGCSVLDILFYLDLSLLEVLFIYTVKMIPNERFDLSTHISSLEFVTKLPNSNKGWAKGHVLVLDPWSGLSKGSDRVFTLQCSLEITSKLCLYHFHLVLLLFYSCC